MSDGELVYIHPNFLAPGMGELRYVLCRLPEVPGGTEPQLPTAVTGLMMHLLLAAFVSVTPLHFPTSIPGIMPPDTTCTQILWVGLWKDANQGRGEVQRSKL